MKKRFVDARIWVRRGTSAQWAQANPVLGPGEIGYDLEKEDLRIGNGVDAWNALPENLHLNRLFEHVTEGPQGPEGIQGEIGAEGPQGTSGDISGAQPFYQGEKIISVSRTLDTSKNWMTIGPIEIADGVEITVEGSWVIV